jgi:hypothetical protein
MFGYTTKAEWGRIIFHMTYLGIFLPLVLWFYENPVIMSLEKRVKSLFQKKTSIKTEVET